MPIFEYKCECGFSTEKIQPFGKRTDHVKCGKCDQVAKRLEINKTSFTLNGGGWYKDGYQK